MNRFLAVAVFAALLPSAAAASGFSVSDLNKAGTLDQCLDRAERMYEAFGVSPENIKRTPWQVAAFYLSGVNYQSILVCSQDSGIRRATLIVTSEQDGNFERRQEIRARLKTLW